MVKLRLHAPPAAQRLLRIQLQAPCLQLLQLPRSPALSSCSLLKGRHHRQCCQLTCSLSVCSIHRGSCAQMVCHLQSFQGQQWQASCLKLCAEAAACACQLLRAALRM